MRWSKLRRAPATALVCARRRSLKSRLQAGRRSSPVVAWTSAETYCEVGNYFLPVKGSETRIAINLPSSSSRLTRRTQTGWEMEYQEGPFAVFRGMEKKSNRSANSREQEQERPKYEKRS